MEKPFVCFGTVTIDCAPEHVPAMIDFYSNILDLKLGNSPEDPFPFLSGKDKLSDADLRMILQPLEDYLPPTWPGNERGTQVHIDLGVRDLPAAVAYAKSIGAKESPVQFSENWRVMLDPAGHPFCLCLFPEE